GPVPPGGSPLRAPGRGPPPRPTPTAGSTRWRPGGARPAVPAPRGPIRTSCAHLRAQAPPHERQQLLAAERLGEHFRARELAGDVLETGRRVGIGGGVGAAGEGDDRELGVGGAGPGGRFGGLPVWE